MDSFSLSEKTLKNLKKLEGKDTKFFSGLYKHFISSLQDEPVIDIGKYININIYITCIVFFFIINLLKIINHFFINFR